MERLSPRRSSSFSPWKKVSLAFLKPLLTSVVTAIACILNAADEADANLPYNVNRVNDDGTCLIYMDVEDTKDADMHVDVNDASAALKRSLDSTSERNRSPPS